MSDRLPYFRTPECIDALRQQLSEWARTRWAHAGTRPNQMRCGVTGDCLFWVHAFKAIGALPAHIEIPDYRKMEAAGDQMKMLRECIEATGVGELAWCRGGPPCSPSDRRGAPPRAPSEGRQGSLPLPSLLVGNVLLFANGMSGAHCGLIVKAYPAHFVHLSRNGFVEEPLRQQHWLDNLAFVYRLMEPDPVAAVDNRGPRLASAATTEVSP